MIVIGGGVGGLSTAARLAARGCAVTVLEQRESLGGRATVHHTKGFAFDAGPALVTAPFVFESLWADCGARFTDEIGLKPCTPFYRLYFNDGSTFAYSGDREAMKEQIARFDPGALPAYVRYLSDSARAFSLAFADMADRPSDSLLQLLRTLPEVWRLQGHISVLSRVQSLFRDPRLQAAFSFQPLLLGANPATTTALYCLSGHLEHTYGVHATAGGTRALVAGIASLVTRHGGTLRTGAQAMRIETKGGRATGVTLAGGETLTADAVVAAIDPATTYGTLLPDLPKPGPVEGLRRRGTSGPGAFIWYFATAQRYPALGRHTLIFGDDYPGHLRALAANRALPDAMTLYLHRQTADDPETAAQGHDLFYAMSPVPNLAAGINWPETAEAYRQKVQQRLEATVLPGLGPVLAASRVLTPADAKDAFATPLGAGGGLEPRLLQTAWFRPQNRSPAVGGLFLAGAGTHPGPGLPGVVHASKIAADMAAPLG